MKLIGKKPKVYHGQCLMCYSEMEFTIADAYPRTKLVTSWYIRCPGCGAELRISVGKQCIPGYSYLDGI